MTTTQKNKISILGCGWLGLPLAEKLLSKGYIVKGSTTSESKISVLKNKGITPFLLTVSEKSLEGNWIDFLNSSEVLIVDIPPKINSNVAGNFVKKIEQLIPLIENSGVKKVLFVSSTSVYADDEVTVTENTIPHPATESGKQLLAVEKLLQRNLKFETTVVRFGGLIGPERHPIKHLAGRENIENPNAPINLIHLDDCIGIILKIITTDTWNELFNGVAPWHPTRLEYYHKKATEMNLAIPKFVIGGSSGGKIISSEKTTTVLGYTFDQYNL